jgi:hypothetical protein
MNKETMRMKDAELKREYAQIQELLAKRATMLTEETVINLEELSYQITWELELLKREAQAQETTKEERACKW